MKRSSLIWCGFFLEIFSSLCWGETSSDWTPLMAASFEGNTERVKLLLKQGEDLRGYAKENGVTALHLAAAQGHVEVIKELLNENANLVDIRDANEATPLHIAASNGHIAATHTLLEIGATIDVRTQNTMTPLALAAIEKHPEVVEEILEHIPQPFFKNESYKQLNFRMTTFSPSIQLQFGSLPTHRKHPEWREIPLLSSPLFKKLILKTSLSIEEAEILNSGRPSVSDLNLLLIYAATLGYEEAVVELIHDYGAPPFQAKKRLELLLNAKTQKSATDLRILSYLEESISQLKQLLILKGENLYFSLLPVELRQVVLSYFANSEIHFMKR